MDTSIIQHIGLISESRRVDFSELSIVAAALQKQVMRDFAPIWNIDATVSAFGRLEDLPLGSWPIVVMDDIQFDAAGIHLDEDGQPFALVSATDDNNVWSLTCSHECLEMLADPFGDKLVAGDSPKPDQGRVTFLMEVCDPPEAAEFAYTVNGVLVSDFYTPHFFDPVLAPAVRYSFTGAIEEPRQVLRGGYLSWKDLRTNDWWQETWFSGTQSVFRNLGPLDASHGSIRSQIDRKTAQYTAAAVQSGRKFARAAGLAAMDTRSASESKAATLRRQINALVGKVPAPATATVSSIERRSARHVAAGRH